MRRRHIQQAQVGVAKPHIQAAEPSVQKWSLRPQPATPASKAEIFHLQHSAFCSLRIFMAVRYAENLTLFKSAAGRKKTKLEKNPSTGQHLQDFL